MYTLFSTYPAVAYIYWDASDAVHLFLTQEQHGYTWDPASHAYEHRYTHTVWVPDGGLALTGLSVDGSGNVAASAQFGVASGNIQD
jgi:hypothetical protein